VDDILGRAKSLGIKFEKEMEEDLDRLSELQELLHDAERRELISKPGVWTRPCMTRSLPKFEKKFGPSQRKSDDESRLQALQRNP
jgi:hypothetical protein